jgi:hypothetical protein
MAIVIASKEDIQEYYQSDSLGQSKLKLLLGDLSSFHKEFDSSAEHFLIGSAVDCILTSTQEEFNNTYYKAEVDKKPSETILSILDLVYNDLLQDYSEYLEVSSEEEKTSFQEFVGELADHSVYLLKACEDTGWQPRWGAEAKLKNIIESSEEYFTDLCKSFGKTILSKTQAETIQRIVTSLENNPRTSGFFNRDLYEYLPVTLTVYYQFPIYFDYRGVNCKALLDIVFISRDEEANLVSITGVDLKTMNGNTYHFPSSVRTRRYDIQAAWYTLALQKHFAIPEESSIIKPFQFVVESTSYQGKPLNFVVDDSLLTMGRFGRRAIKSNENSMATTLQYEIKGFEQLLDLYIYHSENGFTEEKEIQETGLNSLKINWDGIVSE